MTKTEEIRKGVNWQVRHLPEANPLSTKLREGGNLALTNALQVASFRLQYICRERWIHPQHHVRCNKTKARSHNLTKRQLSQLYKSDVHYYVLRGCICQSLSRESAAYRKRQSWRKTTSWPRRCRWRWIRISTLFKQCCQMVSINAYSSYIFYWNKSAEHFLKT